MLVELTLEVFDMSIDNRACYQTYRKGLPKDAQPVRFWKYSTFVSMKKEAIQSFLVRLVNSLICVRWNIVLGRIGYRVTAWSSIILLGSVVWSYERITKTFVCSSELQNGFAREQSHDGIEGGLETMVIASLARNRTCAKYRSFNSSVLFQSSFELRKIGVITPSVVLDSRKGVSKPMVISPLSRSAASSANYPNYNNDIIAPVELDLSP